MILLIVTVKLRPGTAGEYVRAFSRMAMSALEEDGCIEYGIYSDSTDARFDNEVRDDTVVLCEKWRDIESLQQHTRNSVALNEFRQTVKDIKLSSTYRLLSPAETV